MLLVVSLPRSLASVSWTLDVDGRSRWGSWGRGRWHALQEACQMVNGDMADGQDVWLPAGAVLPCCGGAVRVC
jgi:hypothetical protein